MLLFVVASAHGASWAPLTEEGYIDNLRRATAIVDATVVEVEPDRVYLKVHRQLKGGEPPPYVKRNFEAGVGGPPTEAGTRALLILIAEDLETHPRMHPAASIREGENGQLEYEVRHGEWEPLAAFERRLAQALETAERDPVRILAAAADSSNPPSWILSTAHESLKQDDEFMRELIRRHPTAIRHASDHLRGDPELVYRALLVDSSLIQHVAEEIRTDAKLLRPLASRLPLHYLPASMQDDREVVLAIINRSRTSAPLQWASDRLRRDPELVLLALRHDPMGMQWVHEELRSDPGFAGQAVRLNLRAAAFLEPEVREHPAVKRWTDDREFVLREVTREARRFEGASERLRDDPEVILAGASYNLNYRAASERLLADRNFVASLVRLNPSALISAAPELRGDRELVLEALRRNPSQHLRNAGPALQDDREVVLTAVRNWGGAILFASDRLRSDPDVVIAAIETTPDIVRPPYIHIDGQARSRIGAGGVQWHPEVRRAIDEAIRRLRSAPHPDLAPIID